MDVMEIDGASNRGIDQIRELKSHVGLASFMGGTKVYILDEVHMLTMEAFNALLKTLEEPPPSVMFIFATTEPHKVPATIRSRCQHILFHRITAEFIAEQLSRIASAENVIAEGSALWEIARSADGALRDAISLFEQAVAVGRGALTMDSIRTLFGGGSRAEMERWIIQIRENPDDAAAALKRTLDLGVSGERFLDGLFPLLRDMWTFGLWGEKSFTGTSLSDDEKDFLRKEAPNWDTAVLRRAAMTVASLFPRVRLGLRNEVFAGLLMFELLGAFDPSEPIASERVRPAAAESPAPSRRVSAVNYEAPDVAASPVPNAAFSAVPPLRTSGGGDIRPMLMGESGEILSRLMKDDLPLAAALLDVSVFRAGNAFEFDFSEAPQPAVVMLSGTRAALALEHAFGIAPDTPSAAEDVGVTERPAESGNQSPASVISVRLGADILMSKRLDSVEMDIGGDGEDEQL
jgi:DNA polymerase-3 subunit gamma/tau